MTYSIVARDGRTGELGAAAQSHFFAVGPSVLWAESGVGVVVTQSFTEVSYGPLGLGLMRGGKPAPDALNALVLTDALAPRRQVAMIDGTGLIATHTGAECVPAVGAEVGDGVAAQGNMLANDSICGAMVSAYCDAPGDMGDRLLAALHAGEAAGGDVRGSQSAAMLVVKGESAGRAWEDVVTDLRVDDHADPLGELERLLALDRFYRRLGDLLFPSSGLFWQPMPNGALETEAALAELAAGQKLLGRNPDAMVWRAILLGRLGRMGEARELMKEAIALHEPVIAFVRGLPTSGLCTSELVDELLTDEQNAS